MIHHRQKTFFFFSVSIHGNQIKQLNLDQMQIQDEIHGAVWKTTRRFEAYNRLMYAVRVILNINKLV